MTSAGIDGPCPLTPGATLAPGYHVVAHLRRGYDLDVYDLWSEERGCRCVGKTIRPDRLQTRGVRARLLQEGRLLRRLTHPHIVRAYEVILSSAPAVILETLPGETLAHLIDRRTCLRGREVAQLGLHLCSAIGYLHPQGILHLDLTPSNVSAMHGIAKVIDLSLARPPGPSHAGIGTCGYMAPEQTAGGVLTPKTDVWSIGATLYETASGEPACDVGDDSRSSGCSQLACAPASLRRLRGEPGLAAAIARCLCADPHDRPTLPELTAVLAAAAGDCAAEI
jgi:serine/threonine protein kinase